MDEFKATNSLSRWSRYPSKPLRHLDAHSQLSVEDRVAVTAYLQKVTDTELKQILDRILKQPDFRSKSGYEPCLAEIIRRGGRHWELFLQRKLDTLMKAEVVRYKDADDLEPGGLFNLELLTALRRVKKQADPLQVFVDTKNELTGTRSNLPKLRVRIQNMDAKKIDVGFTMGGNYRSGRHTRWRLVLRDEDGDAIPMKVQYGSFIGGGVYSEQILEHGEYWETSLRIESYVQVPPPGEYSLSVQYHNTQRIATDSETTGMIVSQSSPITLTITPVTISRTHEERQAVRQLVTEFNGQQSLKIVAESYGEWAHELIPPQSPEGQLLSSGTHAIPTIIEMLDDRNVSLEKRAWLFGILYSLTGENDPRSTSAVGRCTWWEEGWQIWGAVNGNSKTSTISFGAKGTSFGGEIDAQAQSDLTATRKKWLQMAVVKNRSVVE